jgi:hypothetical protein
VGEAEAPSGVAWYYAMPLLNNRFLWWDMLKVTLISPSILVLFGSVIMIANEDDPLPLAVVGGIYGVCIVLFGLGVLITALLYGNKFGTVFRVDNAGVSWESGVKEQAMGKGLIALSVLTGSMGAVGTSLIADSQNTGGIPWRKIRRANIHPGPRVISIRNSWRVVTRLFVRAEDWDTVVGWVQWGLAEGERQRTQTAG